MTVDEAFAFEQVALLGETEAAPVAAIRGKRLFDLAVALILGLVLLPLVAVVAVLIRVTSPGRVIFRQRRIGHLGEPFEMLKFRTMVDGVDEPVIDLRVDPANPISKQGNDPRLTRVGRLLRRASIDEIPQLWNVLLGEMSLVGPRPALPHEVGSWPPELHRRLDVVPGLTGLWQVSGRSDLEFADYIRLDLEYVETASFTNDLRILARTVPAVLSGRGAR